MTAFDKMLVALSSMLVALNQRIAAYDPKLLSDGGAYAVELLKARAVYSECRAAQKSGKDRERALILLTLVIGNALIEGEKLLEDCAHAAGVIAGSNSAACEAAYSEGVQDGESNARYAAEQYQRALDLMCRCLDPGLPVADCPVHGIR